MAFDLIITGDFSNEVNSAVQLGMALYTSVKSTQEGAVPTIMYVNGYYELDENNQEKLISESYSSIDIITYATEFSE